jgi:hypothetical protein
MVPTIINYQATYRYIKPISKNQYDKKFQPKSSFKEIPNFEEHKIYFVQTFLLDASDSLVDGYGSGSV